MGIKNNGGLDLSGVGKSAFNLNGGSKTRPGLSFSSGASSNGGTAVPPPSRSLNPSSFGGSMFGNDERPSTRRRNMILAVIAVVLGAALVIGAGVIAYMQSVQNEMKPTLNSAVASEALVQAEDEEIVWALYAETDQNESSTTELTVSYAALIALDASNARISVLWLPSNLRVYVAGYGYKSLSDAYNSVDDASFITAVSGTTGVEIAHYFKSSRPGMQRLASNLELDPELTGESYASALAQKLLESSSEQLSSYCSALESLVATDMSQSDLAAFLEQFRGLDVSNSYSSVEIPLDSEAADGDTVQVKADSLATMLKRVDGGLAPVATKSELSATNATRSETSVTIWNGVGVSGIASDCATYLKDKGWQIESTGNAASFVYPETLVVYNYDEDKEIAELLVSDLGQGRAVRSAARYSFDGDILLVIGKDYQPF